MCFTSTTDVYLLNYIKKGGKTVAKKEEIKITALYERLSRDDEQAGESNSILIRKSISKNMPDKRDWEISAISMTMATQARISTAPALPPCWKKSKPDGWDTLVVKDLSRFGRNYLQVGYYTEIVFPKKVFALSLSTTMWIVPIQPKMTSHRFWISWTSGTPKTPATKSRLSLSQNERGTKVQRC